MKLWRVSLAQLLVEAFVRLGFPRSGSKAGALDAESLYRLLRNAALFTAAGCLVALLEAASGWLSSQAGRDWTGIFLTVLLGSLADGLRRWRTDYSRLMDHDLEDSLTREGTDGPTTGTEYEG